MRLAILAATLYFAASAAFCLEYGREPSNDDMVIESLIVREMPIRGFAELITRSSSSRWTVMVSEGAAEKQLDLYLERTGVELALKAVCSAYGLWYKRTPGSSIVQIMTLEEFRSGLNLYAEEAVEVITLKYPQVEEVCETLQKVFLDRVIWSRTDKDENDPYDRLERAFDRMELLTDRATIAEEGSIGSSSSNSNSNYSNNRSNLRSNNNSRNRNNNNYRNDNSSTGSGNGGQNIQRLEQERSRAEEVLLRNYQDDSLRQLYNEQSDKMHRPGLVYISALVASNDLVLRSNDPASLARVREVAVCLDRPSPQVLLEVKVLDVTLGDEHERGLDWLFSGGALSASSARGASSGTGSLLPNGNLILRPDENLIPQGGGLDNRSAVFGLVTEHVRARLQLLQDNNRIVSLATPNLLVADNEASRVFIGTEMTVVEKVETETDYQRNGDYLDRTITHTVTAPRRRIGTSLLITPKIHADRSVTISILQENSALGANREVILSEGASFVSNDVEERSVTTTVVAQDGNIIAIGGLISESSEKRVVGTPGLHRIPMVGELFKRTSKYQERHEMLILIRPYVLLAPGEGEAESLDLMERLSRHPSARPEFPSLGVGAPEEMPMGDTRSKTRDDLKRLKKQSPIMSVEPFIP